MIYPPGKECLCFREHLESLVKYLAYLQYEFSPLPPHPPTMLSATQLLSIPLSISIIAASLFYWRLRRERNRFQPRLTEYVFSAAAKVRRDRTTNLELLAPPRPEFDHQVPATITRDFGAIIAR